MQYRHVFPLSILAGAALFVHSAPRALASYEYVWDPGLSGFSGELYLDTNSSSNGSLADIVSLSVTSPNGTYVFNPSLPSQISIYQSGYYNQLQSTFSWDPTQITEMNILFDYRYIVGYGGFSYANIGENAPVYGVPGTFIDTLANGAEYQSDFTGTGNWVAVVPPPVPDQTSTLALLGLVAAGFVVAEARKQSFRGRLLTR